MTKENHHQRNQHEETLDTPHFHHCHHGKTERYQEPCNALHHHGSCHGKHRAFQETSDKEQEEQGRRYPFHRASLSEEAASTQKKSSSPRRGNCPRCQRHCSLSSPGCGLGAAYARSRN